MSRVYNNTNKIRFTSISEKYQVPRSYKGALSNLHSAMITYVCSHYKNTKKYRKCVVDALNLQTYAILSGDLGILSDWSPSAPLTSMPAVDEDIVESVVGDLLLAEDSILWDVEEKYSDAAASEEVSPVSISSSNNLLSQVHTPAKDIAQASDSAVKQTPKQDLYIQPPGVPLLDYSSVWMEAEVNGELFAIHKTLPEIPTRQNEISVTTEVGKMTRAELLNLFPNNFIRTRHIDMYDRVENIHYDEDLGIVIPIKSFTLEQLVDNIIKYPHFFKLTRIVNGKVCSFYTHIEIDGELHDTLKVWDSLPESSIIPRTSNFIKEYVVRRYLLERDIEGIEHKYPMNGTLDPFLTLFMDKDSYIQRGYSNVESIARSCVESRVSYKQSRNPMIRRMLGNEHLHL